MNTPFKEQIDWLPDFIGEELMNQQELQGNKRDISVFETNLGASTKGFTWAITEQGDLFWRKVLKDKDINLFLAWFKPELEVWDGESGIFINRVISYNEDLFYPFFVKKATTGGYAFKHARLPKKESAEKLELLKKADELLTKAAELKAAAEKL